MARTLRRMHAGVVAPSIGIVFLLAGGLVTEASAAGNLTINRNMTISSDVEYNKITGSGSRNLTVTGARVTANDIGCATVHLLSSNAVITSAQNFRMGPMYVENSTLTAGNIFQTSATGRVVTNNSHIEAKIISMGWDYLLDDGSINPPDSQPPATPPDGPHQHNNSVLTAQQGITFYGGLEVVSGDTVVTSIDGNIFARMVDGLVQRPGATLTLRAPNGNIMAQNIVATNVLADSVYANDASIQDGSLTLTGAINESGNANVITNSLTLQNSRASIAALKVGGRTSVSGGELHAGELNVSGGLTFNDHARASIESLALQNGTLLAINSRVAVDRFTDSTGASAVVGNNAALGLGTADANWIVRQFDTADASSLGPVTAALAVAKPQTLSTLPGIVVDGAVMGRPAGVTPGRAIFAPGSLLVVNAASAAAAGAGALSGGSFDVRSGAKLYIPDAVNGATYKVLNGAGAYADASAWNGANLASGTPLLELVRLPQFGMIGTRQVPAASVLPGLDPSLSGAADEAFGSGSMGPNWVDSDIAGIRFLSRATGRDYIGNDARLAAITIESAARMAVLGAVPQMTMAANQAASNAMGQRTGTEPEGGMEVMGEDGEPVEDASHRHGWALWIMPLFQSTNGFGMTAGNWDMDFSGTLGGIALGCDYTFESALRLGLSLNLGGGYARGSGELAPTDNKMGFWGLGAYAGWQRGNFGLAADVAYTSAYNSLKQDLPAGMQMRPLKSEVSSWALGAGLRAECRIPTPWLDVTPHAGVRYLYLNTDSYDVKSNGTVLEGEAMHQNIWTFPVGVSFSRDLPLPSGWSCRPMLDISVIPAAGDMDAKTNIRFTGTRTDVELETQIMDHITWRGALGVEFSGGDMALGLSYSFQGGLKTSAQGVTASFSYQF
ncbi:MAG: autotransporter outer membrane beta-barrel domain-containing protein [Desulfovibrio sp.]|uniref:autotransporter outer membrane beta-barrel domain-containing protein n=1 Tax=Desulfovibrio sp. TaxID=885 RepID=UPI001A68C016|nr:autotransporter outer membrane beta-barrel domain-containing protein [Desulfovibrio sp.]MBD5416553.1 autotransporter outer membrane beta-barrel domain-containing protein [Desulfovibrio sp.]